MGIAEFTATISLDTSKMMKLLFLSALIGVSCAGEIDWFVGKWLPVVLYPNILYEPHCDWHEVRRSDVVCSCGDKGNVDVLTFTAVTTNKTNTQAVLIVNSEIEIANVIALNCTCDKLQSIKHPEALLKMNDYAFATYEQNSMWSPKIPDPNIAVVSVKTVPKLTELRDLIYSKDSLKARKPGLLCEPTIFKPNDST